jgi:hypothetical protein
LPPHEELTILGQEVEGGIIQAGNFLSLFEAIFDCRLISSLGIFKRLFLKYLLARHF